MGYVLGWFQLPFRMAGIVTDGAEVVTPGWDRGNTLPEENVCGTSLVFAQQEERHAGGHKVRSCGTEKGIKSLFGVSREARPAGMDASSGRRMLTPDAKALLPGAVRETFADEAVERTAPGSRAATELATVATE